MYKHLWVVCRTAFELLKETVEIDLKCIVKHSKEYCAHSLKSYSWLLMLIRLFLKKKIWAKGLNKLLTSTLSRKCSCKMNTLYQKMQHMLSLYSCQKEEQSSFVYAHVFRGKVGGTRWWPTWWERTLDAMSLWLWTTKLERHWQTWRPPAEDRFSPLHLTPCRCVCVCWCVCCSSIFKGTFTQTTGNKNRSKIFKNDQND